LKHCSKVVQILVQGIQLRWRDFYTFRVGGGIRYEEEITVGQGLGLPLEFVSPRSSLNTTRHIIALT
jgi:hypothetical protein